MSRQRQPEFQRNLNLEKLLVELNDLFKPLEQQVIKKYQELKYPVILVIGAPRSGTTMMMQWLASLGVIAYPTNLLSRFYGAPYIGAKIQQLLTDPTYNFNDEFMDLSIWKSDFQSNLGKTQGVLEPNEFWYFWRRFFPNTHPRYLTMDELRMVNAKGMVAELAALQHVFKKPWAMKGLILQYNLPFLNAILDKVLFIFVKRHPFYNIQSLLQAREKYFGTRNEWYSVQPREYKELKELNPFEQVAGQVYFTNKDILKSLSRFPPINYITVDYERFCKDQDQVYKHLADRFSTYDYYIPLNNQLSTTFHSANRVHFSSEDCEAIILAYKKIAGKDISL